MNDFTLQNFIRNGYVVLKPDFPDELHQIIHRKTQLAIKNGNPGNKIFEQIPELHKIFDHVEIRRTLSQIVIASRWNASPILWLESSLATSSSSTFSNGFLLSS